MSNVSCQDHKLGGPDFSLSHTLVTPEKYLFLNKTRDYLSKFAEKKTNPETKAALILKYDEHIKSKPLTPRESNICDSRTFSTLLSRSMLVNRRSMVLEVIIRCRSLLVRSIKGFIRR